MQARSFDLVSTFVVMDRAQGAVPVPVTPTLYEELDRRFDGFHGHVLISTHAFHADWPSWEIHPAGDEVVLLLSGRAEMVLRIDGREEAVAVESPGSCVIVPKGTWHTARTATPTRMLFVTPGAGTLNEPA